MVQVSAGDRVGAFKKSRFISGSKDRLELSWKVKDDRVAKASMNRNPEFFRPN